MHHFGAPMIPAVNVLLGLPDESGSGKSVTLRASANAAAAPQQYCRLDSHRRRGLVCDGQNGCAVASPR